MTLQKVEIIDKKKLLLTKILNFHTKFRANQYRRLKIYQPKGKKNNNNILISSKSWSKNVKEIRKIYTDLRISYNNLSAHKVLSKSLSKFELSLP